MSTPSTFHVLFPLVAEMPFVGGINAAADLPISYTAFCVLIRAFLPRGYLQGSIKPVVKIPAHWLLIEVTESELTRL